MIFKKKTSKKRRSEKLELEILRTAHETLQDALKTILTTEQKRKDASGQEVLDLGLTVSAIRMKARLALDFVDNLENGIDKINK